MTVLNRRKPREPVFDHGLRRAMDSADALISATPAVPPRRPNGLPLVLLVALAMLTVTGVMSVRARARVLGLGAEIAEMTAEHSRLLDQRRRLAAERAYLRHPDYIQSVATSRLHMIPAAPEWVQKIRLSAPEPAKAQP